MHILLTVPAIGVLVLLVINGAALAYLLGVPSKSEATWWLIARTAAAVVYWGAGIHGGAALDPSPWVLSVVIDAALLATSIAFVQFAYHYLGTERPREARVALWALSGLWVGQVALTTANVAVGGALVPERMLWVVATAVGAIVYGLAFAVLARKWRAARRAGDRRRAQAFAVFVGALGLLVVAVAGEAVTLTTVGPQSLVPLYFQAAHTLLLVVAYVQYAPEPTTFQVKLVGFSLTAALLLLFAVTVATVNEAVLTRETDLHLESRALAIGPTADGGLRATPGDAPTIVPTGRVLDLGDDDAVRVALPFAFPFFGRTYDAVWVGSNGALAFGPAAETEDFPAQEASLLRGRPRIAVAYEDHDPSAGGTVTVSADSGAVTVTWADVPLYGTDPAETTTAQATLRPDGRVELAYGEVAGYPAVGLLPGGRAPRQSAVGVGLYAESAGPGEPLLAWDALGIHARLVPLAWLVLATAAFVLLVFPAFFHLSLVRPLHRLLGGVRRVNDGDLETAVPVGANDEIGQLADNFNRMTDSLRAYAGRMEELVLDRTAALEASLGELRDTQDRLVQQEKLASLGQLTAGIAHEIKNPLNFVNNFAGLSVELTAELRQAIADDDREEARVLLGDLAQNAERIVAHGARADGIVRAMMDHARQPASAPARVDLNALVAEHAELAWHGMKARDPDLGVEFRTDLAADVGAADAFPADLGRVVLNLVTNAIEAVRDRTRRDAPPAVTVRTRRLGDRIEIAVEDAGDGLAPGAAERLFEPFFTTKPTGLGNTGLGLSIGHDIVVAHGGTLAASDGPSDGALFTVSLPAPSG